MVHDSPGLAGDLRSFRDALTKRAKTAILEDRSIRENGRSEVSEIGNPPARINRNGYIIPDADLVHGDAAAEECILIGPLDIPIHNAALRLRDLERDLRMRVSDSDLLDLAFDIEGLTLIEIGRYGMVRNRQRGAQ